jgi:hypothetical protein
VSASTCRVQTGEQTNNIQLFAVYQLVQQKSLILNIAPAPADFDAVSARAIPPPPPFSSLSRGPVRVRPFHLLPFPAPELYSPSVPPRNAPNDQKPKINLICYYCFGYLGTLCFNLEHLLEARAIELYFHRLHKVDHATSQNRDVTGTHLRTGSFLKPLYFLVGLLQLLYQLFFAYAREHTKKNHQQQKQASKNY